MGVEGRPVVGQDGYGPPVGGDGPGQDVDGVGGVLRPCPGGQGDAQPGGVVDDLVDGGPVPAGQGHFEGVQLPQLAGPGSGEAGVGRAGTLGPLDAGQAVAGQDPVDGGDAGQRIHPLLLEVEADGDAARVQAPGGQFGVQGRHGRLRVGPVAAVGAPGRARGRVERGRPRPRPPGADAVEAAQRDAHAPAERPRAPGARGDELHDLQPLGKTDLTRHAPGSPETYHNIWHCQKS